MQQGLTCSFEHIGLKIERNIELAGEKQLHTVYSIAVSLLNRRETGDDANWIRPAT